MESTVRQLLILFPLRPGKMVLSKNVKLCHLWKNNTKWWPSGHSNSERSHRPPPQAALRHSNIFQLSKPLILLIIIVNNFIVTSRDPIYLKANGALETNLKDTYCTVLQVRLPASYLTVLYCQNWLTVSPWTLQHKSGGCGQ